MAAGGRHVLLHNRRTGTLTAILRCAPIGLDLADPDQADQWVAAWGGFLADLGYQPLVRHIAVTVDTAPTGGGGLATHVTTHLDPARAAAGPAGPRPSWSPTPRPARRRCRCGCRCAWTRTGPPRNRRICSPPASRSAAGCPGSKPSSPAAGSPSRAAPPSTWLARAVRAAFDPAARPHLAAAGLEWADAVPVAAREEWDLYRHESGVSVSWALREAPRQAVDAAVLAPLVAPGPYRAAGVLAVSALPRRPSRREGRSPGHRRTDPPRLGRPHPRGMKPNATATTATAPCKPPAKKPPGAGVGRFTLYTTTTVTDDAELSAAVADVEQRAGQARLRLRRLRGAQAAGFAAALGMGVDPDDLLTLGTSR